VVEETGHRSGCLEVGEVFETVGTSDAWFDFEESESEAGEGRDG